MSNIPSARTRLLALAGRIERGMFITGSEIRKIVAEDMHRPSPIRRAERKPSGCTPEVIAMVKRLAKAHPHASFRDIGMICNIDAGRVSEIMRGLRG